MADVLIKNEAGTGPLATGRTNDPINADHLHVTDIDPVVRIVLGNEYVVGLDNGTNMVGRMCTALAGTNATFTK
ncbi:MULTISPECIES: hypothetical protein [Flavobacterium]|jgi:hypothetical protein|uniref:Uncharacterized protein n=1 Tax=Flavobacterium tructae TaxID=1114873 RepID=A0A1S1J5A1_9FLAO|nr:MULTISPECIES: hypothetical protein [Flavobacterium]MDL2143230.1 hypothetical protein [Flavobacterium tructae]OHT44724.1 hypothetical protein BHE19_13525 [Flavobacterium tructae]OXB19137.1 hypothetical protein B0A71_11340 [Flavobacterium tructae]OXB22822.1 hypothetical protein B0A80_13995 [Flavobacterium tructae]URC13197.1 hypothetical protein M4I44_02010 [Flavobacterium sp. B183]